MMFQRLVETPAPQPEPLGRADDNPAARLDHHEKARLRVAVHRAKQLYPPPVARLIERELMTWEEFGHRLDMHGDVAALVHHLTTTPLP